MRNRLAKIVATIGPASSAPSMIRLLHETGVDLFRLNMSHGDREQLEKVFHAIRALSEETQSPIGVFADLQGPKIRTGVFPEGAMSLRYGGEYALVEAREQPGDDANAIPIPHPELLEALREDDVLMFDDGKLRARVTGREGDRINVRADTPGPLKNKKGVNLPGRLLKISALTEKDRSDLDWALQLGVDYIALSFVQRAEDVEEAKRLIAGRAGVISKIEKPAAVDRIDHIIAASDAIMVARGDLGVECPPEDVPLIQRRIIRQCRMRGKPVIVATHMLESMVDSVAPTRAEASDVSTAVYQGADAVMLSAETAVGRHPASAVAIMDRIIAATERDEDSGGFAKAPRQGDRYTTADAITLSAREIAQLLNCRFAVAYTKTGSTARRLSRDRPHCPIIAATPDPHVASRLSLYWGVRPIATDDIEDFHQMIERADALARRFGAEDGERIIALAGYPFGRPGKTNTIKISRIGMIDDR